MGDVIGDVMGDVMGNPFSRTICLHDRRKKGGGDKFFILAQVPVVERLFHEKRAPGGGLVHSR
jgi:hypothetical protein